MPLLNRCPFLYDRLPVPFDLCSAALVPCHSQCNAVPRFARPIPGGVCAHLVTRGNARSTVFHADTDFAAFKELIAVAQERIRVDILAWCLMPNHVHLVVRPRGDGDLSRWMHWLLTTHVQRYRTRHRTTGRIWQGRYKAFPIQADTHLLMVLRYVERNPVRANLVPRSIEWPWSSARERRAWAREVLLEPSPVELPQPWPDWVDRPLSDAELSRVRTSVERSRPLGDPTWARELAARLDLLGTLRPRGRPPWERRPSNPPSHVR